MILPDATLGLLGGGQLGRMFALAARTMGYRVMVLDPVADSPAAQVANSHLAAAYDDERALERLACECAAVTTEFENVPAGALERLAEQVVVSPPGASVAIAQDRIVEKSFVRDCGIPVAAHAVVHAQHDLRAAAPELFPGILKSARLGYDGKGQARVANVHEAIEAFERFGRVPCVLERRLNLAMEISVVVARGFDGLAVAFPVAENVHRNGILAVSVVPATKRT